MRDAHRAARCTSIRTLVGGPSWRPRARWPWAPPGARGPVPCFPTRALGCPGASTRGRAPLGTSSFSFRRGTRIGGVRCGNVLRRAERFGAVTLARGAMRRIVAGPPALLFRTPAGHPWRPWRRPISAGGFSAACRGFFSAIRGLPAALALPTPPLSSRPPSPPLPFSSGGSRRRSRAARPLAGTDQRCRRPLRPLLVKEKGDRMVVSVRVAC